MGRGCVSSAAVSCRVSGELDQQTAHGETWARKPPKLQWLSGQPRPRTAAWQLTLQAVHTEVGTADRIASTHAACSLHACEATLCKGTCACKPRLQPSCADVEALPDMVPSSASWPLALQLWSALAGSQRSNAGHDRNYDCKVLQLCATDTSSPRCVQAVSAANHTCPHLRIAATCQRASALSQCAASRIKH